MPGLSVQSTEFFHAFFLLSGSPLVASQPIFSSILTLLCQKVLSTQLTATCTQTAGTGRSWAVDVDQRMPQWYMYSHGRTGYSIATSPAIMVMLVIQNVILHAIGN